LAMKDPEVIVDIADDGRIQLVSFMLDNDEYGVEVPKVCEIIRMRPIARTTGVTGLAEEFVTLHGRKVPIISMRKRFGLPEVAPSNQTRIVVVDSGSGPTGFVVDYVSELIRIPKGEIQLAPLMVADNVDQDLLVGVINHGDRLLIFMEVERIFHGEIPGF
jgi:purine-binding chemotaxis protein CheW